MARTIKLIMVAIGDAASSGSSQNNKYYDMIDLENGYFRGEYGRVGVTKQTVQYPMSRWDKTYQEKIKKGYKDITSYFVEEKTETVEFQDIKDHEIKTLVARLQAYAKHQVATFYNITADKVTEKQVAEAQSILNEITLLTIPKEINRRLIDLYSVIPRKMSDVRSHLLNELAPFDAQSAGQMITREQDLLDTMASQVKQVELVKDNTDTNLTLLDAMGLALAIITQEEIDMIKRKLDDIAPSFANAYSVVNKRTQARFDEYVARSEHKRTELFFHGSRNENWMPILETGLMLRPTSAVISGKMFGHGSYFADRARKSLGYTSSRGSYWAKGSSNDAYMALFDVHLGRPLHTKKRESWMGSLNEAQLKQQGQYDSLFAEGGIDLINNEYIVYNEAQSTVKYIIQLKG